MELDDMKSLEKVIKIGGDRHHLSIKQEQMDERREASDVGKLECGNCPAIIRCETIGKN